MVNTPHNLQVREIDPSQHRREIMALFDQAFGESLTLPQFQWKYEANPLGRMRVWSVWDIPRDRLAACYGAYPRQFVRDGQVITAYQRADSMVHRDYRRRGLFTTMMSAMNDTLRAEGNVAFQFGYSNDNSAKAIRQMPGALELFLSHVYVHPIGAENLLRFALRREGGKHLAALVTPAIRTYNAARGRMKRPDVELSPLTAFSREVEAWSQEMAAHYALFPWRTREFMEWKVFGSPHFTEGTLVAYQLTRGHERLGVCVLFADRSRRLLKVLDVLCTAPETNLRPCIAAIRLHAAKTGHDAITVNVSDGIVATGFRREGFFPAAKVRATLFPLQSRMPVPDAVTAFWHQMPIDRDNFSY